MAKDRNRDKNRKREKDPGKKPAKAASNTQKREKRSLKEYFKGVKLEMKKVVWPTKEELGSYTVIVIVTCVFFAVAFFLIDTGFLAILEKLLGINM